MKDIIRKLVAQEEFQSELTIEEIQYVVQKIVKEEALASQIGAFLVAITNKGVSKEEFFGFASAMRKFSTRVVLDKYVVDSCGTGADFSKTINISTSSAIVANAAGVNVLKQTNSSITSACGSTDFLKALNIDIARIPNDAKTQFAKNGISFVHSPYFNEFARVNNPIRQQVGIKTIFNYLGPLINPAFPNAQLLGTSSNEMCEKMAYALQKLGTDRALVVNGIEPNIDEISICSNTLVYELKQGSGGSKVIKYEVSPEDFGFKRAKIEDIQGGDGQLNAKIIENIFKGEISGPMKNVILMNAGAMIYLGGLAKDMFEGAKVAQNVLDSGLAHEKLSTLRGLKPVCR